MAQLQCQLCGAPVTIAEPLPRDAECGSCKHDLRCCRNCRHYDPAYNSSCRETMADPVEDKTRRNFCEFFYFNRAPFQAAAESPSRAAAARAKLESLFGSTNPVTETPKSPRDSLEGLLRKPKAEGDDPERG